jgi:hypothetical protein
MNGGGFREHLSMDIPFVASIQSLAILVNLEFLLHSSMLLRRVQNSES